MMTVKDAKDRLDALIGKARVDMYKPIQIAEVLRQSRLKGEIDVNVLDTFRNPSLRWRDEVTRRLLGKVSTSSARYQHDVWNLFETVVSTLQATIKVSVPVSTQKILGEFSDLTRVLLGVDANKPSWESDAHIYRVGVTNAADRGLDMWANFGPAIQVKHLTLDDTLAQSIIDQVESDHIVIVCRDVDAKVIEVVAKQINWGRRVRGIVNESELIGWYERCLRGENSALLANSLLQRLSDGFKAEFPQAGTMTAFLKERSYSSSKPDNVWNL